MKLKSLKCTIIILLVAASSIVFAGMCTHYYASAEIKRHSIVGADRDIEKDDDGNYITTINEETVPNGTGSCYTW